MNLAIIQARMGSKRLPGKVLMNIGQKPMLQRVIERVKRAKLIDKVIVATSNKGKDDQIKKFWSKLNTECFRGSEEDVLARFYEAAKAQKADVVVRITADCPFVDPEIIDQIIEIHLKNKNDYTANNTESSYPRGTDVEVFNFKSLEKVYFKAKKTHQREHVTPYIYENPKLFKIKILEAKGLLKRPQLRFCVDKMPDLVLARKISNYFRPREDFGVKEIIKYLDENLRIAAINKDVKQNQNEISVAFIVRADEKIGCGHLIRCRTLSKKLQEMRKCEVKFFPKIDLNKISHFEMVITDLPDIKEEQLNQIRKRAKLLVSIDDGHKIKFSSDILINPNINPKIKHNFSKKTKYFSGKNYLILREEFEKFGKKKKMISEKPKQIFVCFGGSDPNNLSEKTARILMGMKLDKKIRIRIIAGRGEKIKRVISSRRNFILQKNVSNLAEVLWQSDLAIISGGTLMYEACVLGVPSIIICQNQEQFEEADFFSKKEAVINLGVFNKLRSEKLKNKVVKLLESQNLRKRLSANAKRLISFQGAERIAKILLRELNKN